jgi:hypothetical protein
MKKQSTKAIKPKKKKCVKSYSKRHLFGIIAIVFNIIAILIMSIILIGKVYASDEKANFKNAYINDNKLYISLYGIRKNLWADICYSKEGGDRISCWEYKVPYNNENADNNIDWGWETWSKIPKGSTRVSVETESGLITMPISKLKNYDNVKDTNEKPSGASDTPIENKSKISCTCLCTADREVTVEELDNMIKQLEEHKKELLKSK